MKLTPDQIQEICDELHERVQFYDEAGNRANLVCVAEIATQLTEAFIDQPGLEAIRAQQRAEESECRHTD